MYTQCPLCDTQYHISAAELKAALGKVRCAHCDSVFNALSHLSDTLPEIPTLTQATLTVAAEPEAFAPATLPTIEEIDAETAYRTSQLADYPPVEEADWDIAETDSAEPPVITAPAQSHTKPVIPDAIGATARLMADEFAYPRKKPYPFMGTALWSLGILLLLGLLLAQYVYTMRDDLARKPELRPMLEQLCAVVQPFARCEIPLQRNVALIALEGQDVRLHPHFQNTLLVSVTLLNKARFAQPYPAIELTLTDFNGALVGRRRFPPAEYLLPDVDAARGMPPQGAAAVTLELVTPTTAVNLDLTSWSFALF